MRDHLLHDAGQRVGAELVHRTPQGAGRRRALGTSPQHLKFEMEMGISGTDPNSPAPFIAVAHLYFNTTDQVHEAFKAHGGAIMGDIANYTDIKPQFQISETLL